MSAITQRATDLGPDRIRRYRTKIKVRIDSHDREEPLFLDDDVVSCNLGKTVKGAGKANLVVVPRINYMNLIRPNDYINIYFNIGDGEGWTRTFFGMVDKIEETMTVQQSGAPESKYTIVCTDFTKVFEKTQVYFNPHLANRSDLTGDSYGTPNIGGLALMTRGVRVFGSPPDVVVNLLLVMLGFGTQWALPSSYPTRFGDVYRQRRAQFIQNRLADAAREAIENAGGFDRLRENIIADEQGAAQAVANRDASQPQRIGDLFRERGIDSRTEQARIQEAADAGDADRIAEILADRRLQQILVTGEEGRTTNDDRGALDVLRTTLPTATASLLDVIDIFSFVERSAIDGYSTEMPVWQRQGPLMSFIRSLSHELMNELFFDLRPVLNSDDGEIAEGLYSRAPDEIEGNVGDEFGDEVNGITHVPTMVMREYPFSTIDGIDLRGVEAGVDGDREEIGILYFGDIFATEPGRPGRHAVQIPNINIQDMRDGRSSNLATKHLDVAVVQEEEIIKTQFGRSDHEHFNLTEFYADSLLGSDMRFFMHDLLPIVTPIHVMRHGLRVRSLTTRFARFPTFAAERTQPAEPEQEEEDTSPDDLPPAGELGPPCVAADSARFRNVGGNRWGYRRKNGIGPNGSWVMHQGVDIQGSEGTPITAIADGEIVATYPDGVIGGYGNSVVIRHNFDGTIYYSHYAHLSAIEQGPGAGVSRAPRGAARQYAAEGFNNGRSASLPIRVSKGDVIGRMGRTNSGRASSTGSPMGVHLHFEIIQRFPPRQDTQTLRYHYSSPPAGFNGLAGTGSQRGVWSPTIVASSAPRPTPPAGYTNSFDPVQFFADRGADLSALINEGATPAIEESEPDDYAHGPEDDSDGQMPRDDVIQNSGATPESLPGANSSTSGVLDSALTRQQIIRWALLQDHWYQHNLEYLSGRIDMRGAPEIRVGYRLDLPDRNMSFYVEGVNHQWKYPNKMVTTLQVTRGQRSDPYPMYVLPPLDPFEPTETQRRTSSGRLAHNFVVPDPAAVRRSIALRTVHAGVTTATQNQGGGSGGDTINVIDSSQAAPEYNEAVVLASSADPSYLDPDFADVDTSHIRISGDLRFQLELLELDDEVRDALRSLDEAFGFEGRAAEEVAQDGSTTESDSGVPGTDPGAALPADLTDEEVIALYGIPE